MIKKKGTIDLVLEINIVLETLPQIQKGQIVDQEVVIITKEKQEKIGMTIEEETGTGAIVKREDITARKKTKEEKEETVIGVTAVEDQKKERAKMKNRMF